MSIKATTLLNLSRMRIALEYKSDCKSTEHKTCARETHTKWWHGLRTSLCTSWQLPTASCPRASSKCTTMKSVYSSLDLINSLPYAAAPLSTPLAAQTHSSPRGSLWVNSAADPALLLLQPSALLPVFNQVPALFSSAYVVAAATHLPLKGTVLFRYQWTAMADSDSHPQITHPTAIWISLSPVLLSQPAPESSSLASALLPSRRLKCSHDSVCPWSNWTVRFDPFLQIPCTVF